MCNVPRKDYPVLSNTGISDTIPNWFWKLSSHIFFVDLSHNQIRGSFPGLSRIQADSAAIYLGHNRLTGLLPHFTSGVVELDLSNYLFSGSITHFLCDQFSEPNILEYLDLSNNLLSLQIPDCWMNWQPLNVLNLGYNNLSGNLPKSLGSLTELQSLHLRNNRLTGELPSSLQNCTELLFINIGQNEFFGPFT
uniref:Uncharacterized protein n=1 Tax=Nelumbo nucifera TaxID=4432 RepID=A0A822YY29_NELNU|nr:TPA_asm: hypothetical protein HUJ06_008097 [Nelumbo nucifera]